MKTDLAVGLNSILDYSSQLPFLNFWKMARPPIGYGPGGDKTYAQLVTAGAFGPTGYPVGFPSGVDTYVFYFAWRDGTPGTEGPFVLKWEGGGDMTIQTFGVNNREDDYENKRIEFSNLDGGTLQIWLQNITAPLTRIRMVPKALEALEEGGEIFNPAWIERFKEISEVRVKDWAQADSWPFTSWDDRPVPDNMLYGTGGVPIEVIVALANRFNCHLWDNIPYMADDDYVTQRYTYIRDNLNAGLVCKAEYLNEGWNSAPAFIPQFNWLKARAMEDFAPTSGITDGAQDGAWVQWQAKRATQMSLLIDAVFEGEEERIIHIFGCHTAGWGATNTTLAAPMWLAEDPSNYTNPRAIFDRAVTLYFGNSTADDITHWENMLNVLIADGEEALFDWLEDKLINDEDYFQSIPQVVFQWGQHLSGAAAFGKTIYAYEGGQHIDDFILWSRDLAATGTSGQFTLTLASNVVAQLRAGMPIANLRDDDQVVQSGTVIQSVDSSTQITLSKSLIANVSGTKIWADIPPTWPATLRGPIQRFVQSPQCGRCYGALYDAWKEVGSGPFMHYVDVMQVNESVSGASWGLITDLMNQNPRSDQLSAKVRGLDYQDGMIGITVQKGD